MQHLEDCLQFLREQTERQPDCAPTWSHLGLVLFDAGRVDEALEALDRALAIHPYYREAVITRCFALSELGRSHDGFNGFKVLHASIPDNFETSLALGVYCMRHGWTRAGLAQILRAEMMRPGLPFVLSYAAAAFEELGDDGAADDRRRRSSQAMKRLRAGPRSWDAVLKAAREAFYGQWQNPALARVPVVEATVLREAGKSGEAEDSLLDANLRFPGHPELMVELGKFLLAREHSAEATKWFSGAVCMDETQYQAFYELGFLHADNRNLNLAAKALNHAVALRPLFPDYRYHLASVLLDRGRSNEALEEFRRILTLDPGDGYAAVQLASIHIERQEWEKAVDLLRSGPFESWPEALVLQAQAHRDLGHRAKARVCLERALATDETNSEARELLSAVGA
ncbi:MAG: tetratricopeptide repeat protein [Planctomycetota bacterium]|nr:tetratricopeptide repeat protein [Planctomycetota bacterium]